MRIATTTDEPKKVYPFCKVCGWRKGGADSWNGKACKCKLEAEPIKLITE